MLEPAFELDGTLLDALLEFGIQGLERLLRQHARRRDPGEIQLHLDQQGQIAQALLLLGAESARLAIDDAQRADRLAFAEHRLPRVEAHMRFARHQWVVHEARIQVRILDHQHVAHGDGDAAEGNRAWCLFDIQAAARLEPLALPVDERDQDDRHAEGHRGKAGEAVEARLGRRVEHVERSQGGEAGTF